MAERRCKKEGEYGKDEEMETCEPVVSKTHSDPKKRQERKRGVLKGAYYLGPADACMRRCENSNSTTRN